MRPLVPSDNIPQPSPTPAFTSRPKQDPPAMSAMFVALTVVCVLGASAVMTTAGRDGSVGSWAEAASNLLSSIGLGRDAGVPSKGTETLAQERGFGASSVNVDFLATVVRDGTKATNQEFARVYQEISSLKSEVSVLREKSEPTWSSARVDDLRDTVSTLRSNVSLLQNSLDDLSVERDSEADRINKRLAKIEDVISIRADVTAAIPRQTFPPLPRKRAPRSAGWTAEETGNGTYIVRGPTGTFEVTIGSTVPGLGRIEAVKNQGGRLRLVTGKDRAPEAAAE
jgi:hypothetical protein